MVPICLLLSLRIGIGKVSESTHHYCPGQNETLKSKEQFHKTEIFLFLPDDMLTMKKWSEVKPWSLKIKE